jgi:hypothetical protein
VSGADLADRGPSRDDVQAGWVDLALERGFRAGTFWTLTFDEGRVGRVTPERALSAWRWIVRVLNEGMHGKGYRQWCKHSSWSYIAGVDYSSLGAVHLHAVVDGWVDFNQLHRVWGKAYGFVWTKVVEPGEDERVALAHVVKYATKGSDRLAFWFRDRPPLRTPPNPASCPAAAPGGACQDQPRLPFTIPGSQIPGTWEGAGGAVLTGSGGS